MAVKYKLRSPRGATLMAALLFFLVAAVCGSIILAAATATVSRMTTQAEDARAYYSLTSAAQLMRDDLLQSHWQVKVTQTKSGDNVSYAYELKVLDANEDEDKKTFVPDLLVKGPVDNVSVFNSVSMISIQTQKTDGSSSTLPLVYAKPKETITFDDLLKNYNSGANTKLTFYITNDPEGFNGGKYRNTFTVDGKTRQVYWLELTLDSVKIPSGYVDNTKDGDGTKTFEIGWENASIQKLYIDSNSGT